MCLNHCKQNIQMYEFLLVSNIYFWKNYFEHCSFFKFYNFNFKKIAFHISNIRLSAFLENASGHSLQGNPFSHTPNLKSNSQDMGV